MAFSENGREKFELGEITSSVLGVLNLKCILDTKIGMLRQLVVQVWSS